MKKIVAIMAVSVMLLASCGQTKNLTPGFNKEGTGSEKAGSKLPTSPAPIAEKTFWDNWGTTIGVGGTLTVAVLASIFGWKKFCKTAAAVQEQHQ